MFEDIETNNTKKIADLVLNEAIDNGYGTAKDDMSVVVCKFLDKWQKGRPFLTTFFFVKRDALFWQLPFYLVN